MNKTKISAKIVADSINQQGDRIISAVLTFPRIILSEFNKHRMLSSNTSSSRAIPFLKMVEVVQNDPFIPIAWQKEHKGMQGSEYFQAPFNEDCILLWYEARDRAILSAKELNYYGVTKQLSNRLLEPFMWCTVLATGNLESWNHLFGLRCPNYELVDSSGNVRFTGLKSKKEVIEDTALSSYNGKLVEEMNDLDWLKLNNGQAEIHFMDLAEKMYDAVNESVPELLQPGDWHLPMLPEKAMYYKLEDKLKWCVGIHANTSYTVVGDDKELTLENASKIHDKCKNEHHSSVFEHCARAMSSEEYVCNVKGTPDLQEIIDEDNFGIAYHKVYEGSIEAGWCYNLQGFIPYRYFIENNINL